MTGPVIGAIVALASGGAALVAGSFAIGLLWRTIARRLETVHPRSRASLLRALRLFPAALGGLTAAVVVIAFFRLEPADTREVLGLALPILAVATLAIAVASVARVIQARRETARTVRAWLVGGHGPTADPRVPTFEGSDVLIVDSDYPVVAVVGIRKPRLYIASQVMASCDQGEIDAMIAHESAHVAARDNLTRLLFVCAPVVGLGSRCAAEIERAWTRASEEAADDLARRNLPSSLALAAALTKVARMATRSPLPALHASAILSGSGIEHRVRRLLAGQPPAVRPPRPLLLLVPFAAAAAFALSPSGLRQIYVAVEYCVRNLP